MISLQKLAEEKVVVLIVLILAVIIVGLLVTVLPLYGDKSIMRAAANDPRVEMKPYTPLQLAGRDVYIKEGCYNCHSQQIRPFRAETERYGHYSLAAESMYDHPHQWGSKRTGPDLARVGGRYSDKWHEIHLIDPRAMVPESIMPAYPHLANYKINISQTIKNMKALSMIGVPYTKEEIAGAKEELLDENGKPKTELEALISYLQVLGTFLKTNR